MALNIPFLHADSYKLNEAYIKKIKTSYSNKINLIRSQYKLRNTEDTILTNIRSLDLIKKSAYILDSKRYLKVLRRRKGISPLKLLSFKLGISKAKMKRAHLMHGVYLSYIRLLNIVGRLNVNSLESQL